MNDLITTGAIDRKTYIGGSDVSAILGLSPWRTPLQCYEAKVNGEEPITEAKRKFFARRKRQEPVIAEMLQDEGMDLTRLSLDQDQNRYIDAEHNFMAAEIDFEFKMNDAMRARFPDRMDFAAIPNGTLCNGEIKTVHALATKEWGEDGTDEFPIYYAAQCTHGLGITGRPATLLAALFGVDYLILYPVMADAETIAAMRAKCVSFWINNVLARVPPDPVNMEDMLLLFGKVNGRPVQATDKLTEHLHNLRNIRGAIKAHENDETNIKFLIAQEIYAQWGLISPDANKVDDAVIMDGGNILATWKRQDTTRIDAERLRAEHPLIALQCSKTTPSRVLRFPRKKGQ